jgi:hypothetical protein
MVVQQDKKKNSTKIINKHILYLNQIKSLVVVFEINQDVKQYCPIFLFKHLHLF